MIAAFKAWVRAHWPALRLRTILLAVLIFTAALPGLGAIFLRVYENALVRQTEAELAAQGAALAATAQALWPAADPGQIVAPPPGRGRPIDLSADPVLPERPAARPAGPPAPDALAVEARLGPIIEQTRAATLASILFLDRNGQVLHGYEAGGSQAALPEVRGALVGRSVSVLRRNGAYHPRYSFEWLSRASALRVHYARPIIVDGQVVGALVLSRSSRALFRGIYEDRLKILLGVVVIFSSLILLSGLVSRGVTRPIEALSSATRLVAAGTGGVPATPATAAVEIRALYEDFRALAGAIDARSRYLKDFAAAVSHEFKTPLAGIRGAVELLEDHHGSMNEAEQRRFLGNIAADTERLSQLVSRLLDLARADMTQPEAGARTDLLFALRRVADSEPALKIEVAAPDDLAPVAVPVRDLEAVLGVLVENARQAGARRLQISVGAAPGALTLVAQDDGPGVPAADRDRLFEPFFTSRRAQGGTGLGLPIARALLAAHHARIDLTDSSTGARFELTLPLAD